MTNGEKLIEIFPNNTHITLKRTTQFAINPMTLNQQMIVVDNDWWNAEYKEPTTKNDLGVDWIPRKGHWILRNSFLVPYKCSECNYKSERYDNYCPNCGCRMFEPQESEEIRNDKKSARYY